MYYFWCPCETFIVYISLLQLVQLLLFVYSCSSPCLRNWRSSRSFNVTSWALVATFHARIPVLLIPNYFSAYNLIRFLYFTLFPSARGTSFHFAVVSWSRVLHCELAFLGDKVAIARLCGFIAINNIWHTCHCRA